MSNFSGERYSTLVPVCLAAASAPFLTTAQKGSETTPCVTRKILWVCAHPEAGASTIREVNKICLSRLFNFIASNLSCCVDRESETSQRSRGKGFDKSAFKKPSE